MRSVVSIARVAMTKGLAGMYREILPEVSRDSIDWIESHGVDMRGARTLEGGCGYGDTAMLLRERGADVIATDIELPRAQHARRDGIQAALADASTLQFKEDTLDLILSINVLEHLPEPRRFLDEAYRCLRPGGYMYLSWTNWLSPFGGHDFMPFHYLGPRLGYRVARAVRRKDFIQVPFETIWPTHIGATLRMLRRRGFQVVYMTPRYYPALAFICRVPIAREFLTWNCQLLLRKPAAG